MVRSPSLAPRPVEDPSTRDHVRLVVGDRRVALCGAIDEVRAHHHASPAVVVGIDSPLRVVTDERTHASRAVRIAPGFEHALDVGKGRIAVFLLPPQRTLPTLPDVHDLPTPDQWVAMGLDLLRGEMSSFEAVDHALRHLDLQPRAIDDRLHFALDALSATLGDNVPIDALAEGVRLSPTRLMALAREQLGTSLRSYRRWVRTFQVARDYASGAS